MKFKSLYLDFGGGDVCGDDFCKDDLDDVVLADKLSFDDILYVLVILQQLCVNDDVH